VGRKEFDVSETKTEPVQAAAAVEPGGRPLPALALLNSATVAAPSRRDQRGMVSAEWAVGILAAIAIAGVLLAVVTNGKVEDVLLKVVLRVIATFAKYAAAAS
jgi:hypothetical protein